MFHRFERITAIYPIQRNFTGILSELVNWFWSNYPSFDFVGIRMYLEWNNRGYEKSRFLFNQIEFKTKIRRFQNKVIAVWYLWYSSLLPNWLRLISSDFVLNNKMSLVSFIIPLRMLSNQNTKCRLFAYTCICISTIQFREPKLTPPRVFAVPCCIKDHGRNH